MTECSIAPALRKRIPEPKPAVPLESVMHKVACKHCPSAHHAPDPEVLDILTLPHAERLQTAFPCGWNGRRYCRGYCLTMGISDSDLASVKRTATEGATP
jgi:hypothetical protein